MLCWLAPPSTRLSYKSKNGIFHCPDAFKMLECQTFWVRSAIELYKYIQIYLYSWTFMTPPCQKKFNKMQLTGVLKQKFEKVKVLLKRQWLNFQTRWPLQTRACEWRSKQSLGNNQSRQLYITPGRGCEQSWPRASEPDTSVAEGVRIHRGETD